MKKSCRFPYGPAKPGQRGGTAQRQTGGGGNSVGQQRQGANDGQPGVQGEQPGISSLYREAGEPVGTENQRHQPQQLRVVVCQHRVNGVQPVNKDQPN